MLKFNFTSLFYQKRNCQSKLVGVRFVAPTQIQNDFELIKLKVVIPIQNKK